ncbi:uncharacterized protein Z518_07185 [Rhinocladiella mackenziei CBS 650.93]|uniref:Rhinocladiella mackenziei CBS 650.93 unplaced genomic scaffold supercont1.5, whole genome shotgun sequence n=1 Tax=Rhinocladiella mackenziei CBS 650.93 TaxID=1442369 RepID=A0A0D2FNJ7_9EURO|nr:uncharacterized protein Z518_07185 [Rhinocladiella mackenziei CBS 650.93]KIX03632.1 hypothetical protein Z518_07185 [Rhinocladiella mackenziei CBS 650.93]
MSPSHETSARSEVPARGWISNLASRIKQIRTRSQERGDSRHLVVRQRAALRSASDKQDRGSQSVRSGDTSGAQRLPEQENLSLWARAEQKLKSAKPDVYAEFEKLKSTQSNDFPDAFSRAEDFTEQLKSEFQDTERKLSPDQSKVRRNLLKAASLIVSVKDVLTASARFDPTRASSAVLAGFTSLLNVILKKDDLDHTMSLAVRDICSKLLFWANEELKVLQRKQIYSTEQQTRAENSLTELYATVMEFQVMVTLYVRSNELVQVFKSTYKITDITRAKKEVDIIHEECKNSFATISSDDAFFEKNGEVLEWISGENPHEVHREVRNRTKVNALYAFCGEWLLLSKEFKQWNDSEGMQIFWLCSTAGTGKSTLCCRVNEWHEERSALFEGTNMARVYCSSMGRTQAANASSVLHSIMRQLAEIKGQRHLAPPVQSLYNNRALDRSSTANLSDQEIEELLKDIFAGGEDTRIVIDALDECADWKKLLRILRDAGKSHPRKLKIFCTSRFGVQVETYFEGCTTKFLTSELTENDMRQFVHSEIFFREEPDRLLEGKHQDLEERLESVLLRRAGGMFKWVELQLSLFFCDGVDKAPPKNRRDVEEMLLAIETDSTEGDKLLYDTYRQILKRNLSHPHARADATRMFRLMLCSFERLTMSMILEAVRVNKPEDIDCDSGNINTDVNLNYLRSISYNFVKENSEGYVQFAHMSAVDFLKHADEPMQTMTFTDLDCHTTMMYHCLYFLRCLPGCNVRTPDEVSPKIGLSRGAFFSAFRSYFLSYAYRYWARHCAVVIRLSDKVNTDAVNMVADVLSDENWVDAIRLWYDVLYIPGQGRPPWYLLDPKELALYLDPDPGIFIAACYGLPKLAAALVNNTTGKGELPLSRKNHVGQTPLETAICPGINLGLTNRGLPKQVWPTFGARSGEDDGYVELVKILIADLAVRRKESLFADERPFHMIACSHQNETDAAKSTRINLFELFLRHNFDIDAVDVDYGAPLQVALLEGDKTMTLWLLQHKADPQKPGRCGPTPFESALQKGRTESVLTLLEYGCAFQIGADRKTIWHCVVQHTFDQALANTLWEKFRGQSNAQDDRGVTPVMMSVWKNKAGWTNYLLSLNPGLDRPLNGHISLAHLAAARPCPSVGWSRLSAMEWAILSRALVNIDAKDEEGVTPLMVSAARTDLAGVLCLLQLGTHPPQTDRHGRTALHYALMSVVPTKKGQYYHYLNVNKSTLKRTVNILLNAGVNPNQNDLEGISGVMLASLLPDRDLFDSLQDQEVPRADHTGSVRRSERNQDSTFEIFGNSRAQSVNREMVSKLRQDFYQLVARYSLVLGSENQDDDQFFEPGFIEYYPEELEKLDSYLANVRHQFYGRRDL